MDPWKEQQAIKILNYLNGGILVLAVLHSDDV